MHSFSITSIPRHYHIFVSLLHSFFLYGRHSCDMPMFLTFYIECKCNLTVFLIFYLEAKRNRRRIQTGKKISFSGRSFILSSRGATRFSAILKINRSTARRSHVCAATYIAGAEADASTSKGHPRRQLRVLVSPL